MERFSEPSVVLRTVDCGETDRMVSLLTRGRGRLAALAPAARRSRRRYGGSLQPCVAFTAHLTTGRGGSHRLEEVDGVRARVGLQEELPRIARGLLSVELCRELLPEGEPHVSLFDRLERHLDALASGAAGPTSVIAFALETLEEVGLRPQLVSCVVCEGPLAGPGSPPTEAGAVRFAFAEGGTACGRCATRVGGTAPLSRVLLDALVRIQEGERHRLDGPMRREALTLVDCFVAHHVGRPLKSLAFLEQVEIP